MTPLQEQTLRLMVRKHRAQSKQANTRLARHTISVKTYVEIKSLQEEELIAIVRGMLEAASKTTTQQ